MKSAYELAMERLEATSGPSKRLSDEAKKAIAEIDSKYDAKTAAIRLDFDARIASVTTQEEFNALKDELAREMTRAEEGRERDKDVIWEEA